MLAVLRRRRNTRFTSRSHHAWCLKKKEKHKIYFPFTSCLVFQEERETQDLLPVHIMLGVSRRRRNTRFTSRSNHEHKIYFPFTSCLVFQEEGETQDLFPVHIMLGVSRRRRNIRFISRSHHAWCFKKKEKRKKNFPFTSCLVFLTIP